MEHLFLSDPTYLPTVDVKASIQQQPNPKSYMRYIKFESVNRGANITGTNAAGNLLSDAQEQVSISSSFDIEFEWNKPLDHSDSSDTGNVTIYGLSEDTANAIGGLFTTVKLSCGYEYAPKQNDTLFIGDVIDSKFEKEEGGTKLTLQVTANAKQLMIGRKISHIFESLQNTEQVLPDLLAIEPVSFPNPILKQNFVQEDVDRLIQIFLKRFFRDTGQTFSTRITPEAGAKMRKSLFGGVDTVSVSGTLKQIFDEMFRPIGVAWRATRRGDNDWQFFFFTLGDLSPNTGVSDFTYVISSDTGLIGLPYLRTDVVSRSIDQDTASNETALNIKQSYGKDGTPKEVKKYKVRRQGVGFKALIDTDIEPNSIVDILTTEGSTDGLYRVRNVKFKGSNFSQDWYMEVECEGRIESTTRRLSTPTPTATIE